jgi:UDPglucose--hexose-1-phosphate uridylyltransferase
MSGTTERHKPSIIEATGGIIIRATELTDGRELFYFDDANTTLIDDRRSDARQLPDRPPTATMRQDPLTGEWISIAAARQNRVHLPAAEADPLAPASASNPSEIPDNYDVAVFENRSPSFGPDLAEASTDGSSAGEFAPSTATIGLNRTAAAIGRCEVVCFSPTSTGSFADQTVSRARTIVEAWAVRTASLSALPGIQQVFPFENRGQEIGVTLHHPHGQIYSYPYVTPRTQALIRSIESYGPTLFADILASEQASDRMLIRGEYWSAFVPFAARWPLEIHLLPHRHVPDLAATTPQERDELAAIYLRLLRGLDSLYPTATPYIAAWHQAPVSQHRDDIRLMLQITSPRRAIDRLKFLAGSESAMGAFIGDVPPESSARTLREAIARADQEWPR